MAKWQAQDQQGRTFEFDAPDADSAGEIIRRLQGDGAQTPSREDYPETFINPDALAPAPQSEVKGPQASPPTPVPENLPGVPPPPPVPPSGPAPESLVGAPLAPRRPPTAAEIARQRRVQALADQMDQEASGRVGPTDILTNSMLFNFLPQISGGARAAAELGRRIGLPGQQEMPGETLDEVYALYRDAERARLNRYLAEHPYLGFGLSLLGGFAGARPGGIPPSIPRGTPPPPPPPISGTAHQLGIASGYGAGAGALGGAAEHPESWEAQGEGALSGAIGGALLGPAFYLGLRGLGEGARALRSMFARATPEAVARAGEWAELGVPPPPVTTLSGPQRTAAEYLARTPVGGPLTSSTREGAGRLEQALQDAMRFGGGPRTATGAGEEAQALLRASLGTARPVEELRRLPPEELLRMSGVEPPPLPPGEVSRIGTVTAPVPAEYRPISVDELISQYGIGRDVDEGLQVALARAGVKDEPPLRSIRAYEPVGPVPRAAIRPELQDRLINLQKTQAAYREALARIAAGGPGDSALTRMGLREVTRRIQEVKASIESIRDQDTIKAQAQAQKLADAQVDAENARILHEAQRASAERVERLRDEAAQQAIARVRQRRLALENEAAQINRTRLVEATTRAAERRASEAQARLAQQRETGHRPTGLPASRESYSTQLAAGEQALAHIAPAIQGKLLGPLDQPKTHLHQLLNQIAIEAREEARLPGYRPERLFNPETGEIFPGLLTYLREELGAVAGTRVNHLLQRFAQQRSGQLAQGMRGTNRILSQLQAMREARGVNKPLLDRITHAIEQDIAQMAGNTPEGQHWLRQREALRAARARVEAELQEPLRTVTDNPNPAAALNILEQSMRQGGNLNVLRAFLAVAEEKGSREAAVSLLLTNLRGANLREFLQNWRGITPEARDLMFQGPMKVIGTRLERFARAYAHIADFPTSYRFQDNLRLRQLLTATHFYVHLPTAILSTLGQAAGAKLLASPRLQQWMLRAPLTSGAASPIWRNSLGLLAGIISQETGVDETVGRMVIDATKEMIPSAHAGITARSDVEPVIFGGDRAEVDRGDQSPRWEAEQRLAGGESPEEVWRRTGWLIGRDGHWRFEIDDSQAQYNPRSIEEIGRGVETRMRLGDVIEHRELFQRYPFLRDLPVVFAHAGSGVPWLARFSRARGIEVNLDTSTPLSEEMLSNLLHETQHAVQDYEGFAYGKIPGPRRLLQQYDLRTGEREAYEVQDRQRMTREERLANFPNWAGQLQRGSTLERWAEIERRMREGGVPPAPLRTFPDARPGTAPGGEQQDDLSKLDQDDQEELMSLMPQARVSEPPTVRTVGAGKGSVQTTIPPRAPTTSMVAGKRGTVREEDLPEEPEQDSVFYRTGEWVRPPDPNQFLGGGPPRRRVRPETGMGPLAPSAGDIIADSLRSRLPRGSADMLGRALDLTLDPFFEGGRMIAHGAENLDIPEIVVGTAFSLPTGTGLGTFIALPGARRLAQVGLGNAERMLLTAQLMERRGMAIPDIQAIISHRLTELGDTQLGTVTRLNNGQWAIELANIPRHPAPMASYEVRPLREVRADPLLYMASPRVAETRVWHNPDIASEGLQGQFDRYGLTLQGSPHRIGRDRVLEHEVQHAVAWDEGLPYGASPEAYAPGGVLHHLLPPNTSPVEAYLRDEGEWLAREAMERLYWPAELRRDLPIRPEPDLISSPSRRGSPPVSSARGYQKWERERIEGIVQRVKNGEPVQSVVDSLGTNRGHLTVILHRANKKLGTPTMGDLVKIERDLNPPVPRTPRPKPSELGRPSYPGRGHEMSEEERDGMIARYVEVLKRRGITDTKNQEIFVRKIFGEGVKLQDVLDRTARRPEGLFGKVKSSTGSTEYRRKRTNMSGDRPKR